MDMLVQPTSEDVAQELTLPKFLLGVFGASILLVVAGLFLAMAGEAADAFNTAIAGLAVLLVGLVGTSATINIARRLRRGN
jgi:hypothetical protein